MSISTLLLIALVCGLLLYSRYKKALAGLETEQSVEDVDEEQFFSEEENDDLSHVDATVPYFSYETESSNGYDEIRDASPKAPVVAAVVDNQDEPRFNLRQAVISQVILDNRYIGEIN